MADKAAAEQLKTACQGAGVTVKKVERKDKSEKPPALYDLPPTHQRPPAGWGGTPPHPPSTTPPPAGAPAGRRPRAPSPPTSCKTSMKEKLCTYPRTDSRYLTSDMAATCRSWSIWLPTPCRFRKGMAISCDAAQVINDKKVTDHHAVIPTRNLQERRPVRLPVGEKAVLELVALRLLCAVAQPLL